MREFHSYVTYTLVPFVCYFIQHSKFQHTFNSGDWEMGRFNILQFGPFHILSFTWLQTSSNNGVWAWKGGFPRGGDVLFLSCIHIHF